METQNDSPSEGTALRKRNLAVSILYLIELWGLHAEFSGVKKKYRGDDDVWVASYQDEIHGPYRFTDILRMVLDGCQPLGVVPLSMTEQETVPWTIISYEALWSNRRFAIFWGIGTWVFTACVLSLASWMAFPAKHHVVAMLGSIFAASAVLFVKWSPSQPAPEDEDEIPLSTGRGWGTMAKVSVCALMLVAASLSFEGWNFYRSHHRDPGSLPHMASVAPAPGKNASSPAASAIQEKPTASNPAPSPVVDAQPVFVRASPSRAPGVDGAADEVPGTNAKIAEKPNTDDRSQLAVAPIAVSPEKPVATEKKTASKGKKRTEVASPKLAGLELKKIKLTAKEAGCDLSIVFTPHEANPKGLLLLMPEAKISPEAFLTNEWLDFAKENHLAVAGISFTGNLNGVPPGICSKLRDVFHAELGKDAPLLVYGYGRGADLAIYIQNTDPSGVIAWCANGAYVKVDAEKIDHAPAGIIAASKDDGPRFSTAWQIFEKGRIAQRPWTWVSMEGTSIYMDGAVQEFARQYFKSSLKNLVQTGQWRDNDLHSLLTYSAAKTKNSAASYLPGGSLAAMWDELNAGETAHPLQPTIVKRTIKTFIPAQPELNLFLRLPPGAPNGKGVTTVLAFSTWQKESEKLVARLKDKNDPLIKFADRNNLAVLTWNTAQLWKSGIGYDGLTYVQRRQYDDEFDAVARAWDSGVQELIKETGIPQNDYLLYGISGGAHWGHRLALRKPERFLAVHVHVANSYDKPTLPAGKCLWLLTSGEIDVGYAAAKEFYENCTQLGYSMIFKAGTNLGHADSPEIRKISFAFFEYALEMKQQRDEMVRAAASSLRSLSSNSLLVWKKDFQQAPYVGDYVNQDVYPSARVEVIPPSQRIVLPTRDIAEAWGDVHE